MNHDFKYLSKLQQLEDEYLKERDRLRKKLQRWEKEYEDIEREQETSYCPIQAEILVQWENTIESEEKSIRINHLKYKVAKLELELETIKQNQI